MIDELTIDTAKAIAIEAYVLGVKATLSEIELTKTVVATLSGQECEADLQTLLFYLLLLAEIYRAEDALPYRERALDVEEEIGIPECALASRSCSPLRWYMAIVDAVSQPSNSASMGDITRSPEGRRRLSQSGRELGPLYLNGVNWDIWDLNRVQLADVEAKTIFDRAAEDGFGPVA